MSIQKPVWNLCPKYAETLTSLTDTRRYKVISLLDIKCHCCCEAGFFLTSNSELWFGFRFHTVIWYSSQFYYIEIVDFGLLYCVIISETLTIRISPPCPHFRFQFSPVKHVSGYGTSSQGCSTRINKMINLSWKMELRFPQSSHQSKYHSAVFRCSISASITSSLIVMAWSVQSSSVS